MKPLAKPYTCFQCGKHSQNPDGWLVFTETTGYAICSHECNEKNIMKSYRNIYLLYGEIPEGYDPESDPELKKAA